MTRAPLQWKNLGRRVAAYLIGMFLIASGSSLAVIGNLGISPVVSIPYILSLLTAKNFGTLTTVVFCVYIALQVLMLQKASSVFTLVQIIPAYLYGLFINLSGELLSFLQPQTYIQRFILLVLSILVMALGVYVYLAPQLIPMPAEGIVGVLGQKLKLPFSTMKGIFDSLSVTIALTLILIFTGELQGVREGTVLAALCIGPVSGVYKRISAGRLEHFLLGTTAGTPGEKK